MKNFQKTLSIFVFALLLTGVFTLGGCEKTDDVKLQITDEQILSTISLDELAKVSVIKDPKIVAEIDWLFRNNRFASKKDFCNVHRNGILFHSLPDGDELYEFTGLIMSDLLLTRKYVQQELNRERDSKSARHYRQANMFSGGSVTVRIHNNVPTEWRTAIQDACAAWNGLGQSISISSYVAPNNTSVAGQVDIDLTNLGSSSTSTIAATTTVKSGTGGISEIIYINSGSSIYSTIWQTARKMNMAHELGHAIGLGHTDYYESGMTEVASVISCNGVANYTDPTSIMRRSIPYNQSWTGFTTCDQNVIGTYWGSMA